jgi:hypothetical protein
MRFRSLVLALTTVAGITASTVDESRWQMAQFFGQRCQTGQGWCFMSVPAPLGTQCFCPSPFGPVAGFVVQ